MKTDRELIEELRAELASMRREVEWLKSGARFNQPVAFPNGPHGEYVWYHQMPPGFSPSPSR